MFLCSRYIDTSLYLDLCFRYIEILDDPVVLKHLKSDNCPGQIIFMPSLGFDCGETASSITNVEKQFAISGKVLW